MKPLYYVAGTAAALLVGYGAYRFLTGGGLNPGRQVTPSGYVPKAGNQYTPPPPPVDNTAADINATTGLITAGTAAVGQIAGLFGSSDSGSPGDDVQADYASW